jgi:hypothetical protein
MNHRFSRLFAALVALSIIAFQFLSVGAGKMSTAQFYGNANTAVMMLGGLALIAAIIGAPAIMLLAAIALFVPAGQSVLHAVGADRVLVMLNITYLACAIWNVWQGATEYQNYDNYGGY